MSDIIPTPQPSQPPTASKPAPEHPMPMPAPAPYVKTDIASIRVKKEWEHNFEEGLKLCAQMFECVGGMDAVAQAAITKGPPQVKIMGAAYLVGFAIGGEIAELEIMIKEKKHIDGYHIATGLAQRMFQQMAMTVAGKFLKLHAFKAVEANVAKLKQLNEYLLRYEKLVPANAGYQCPQGTPISYVQGVLAMVGGVGGSGGPGRRNTPHSHGSSHGDHGTPGSASQPKAPPVYSPDQRVKSDHGNTNVREPVKPTITRRGGKITDDSGAHVGDASTPTEPPVPPEPPPPGNHGKGPPPHRKTIYVCPVCNSVDESMTVCNNGHQPRMRQPR